jgi:hypothetical protein
MKASGMVSAASRRGLLLVGIAVVMCGTSNLRGIAAAQDPQPQQQQQAQAAPADPLKLNIDGPAILVFQIKKDRVADFEALVAGIRAGLSKSTKEDVKAFAASYYPYKVEAVPGLYLFNLDHPSKTVSYNPVALLFYTDTEAIKREEADALHKKWEGSYDAVNIWPLVKVGG